MNTERDKYIVEALGGCWHDSECIGDRAEVIYECKKCKYRYSIRWETGQIELSTWTGFGWAWERAKGMEWWEEFTDRYYHCCRSDLYLIHPSRFAGALYEFLHGRGAND